MSNKFISPYLKPAKPIIATIIEIQLQYFGHIMRTSNSLEKDLKLGKTEGKRGRK